MTGTAGIDRRNREEVRGAVGETRYAEAEPLLLQSVPELEGTRGVKSDRTQSGYRALRDLYANTGRAAASEV